MTAPDGRSGDTSRPAGADAAVIVVGYGPVGATLAGLLARRGIATIVVDRSTDIFPLPRAAHVDGEAMRILQELGCADAMAAAMRTNTGMDFLTADHRVLLSMRSTAPAASGWPQSSFMHQPVFERQLREAVQGHGVEVRLGCGVEAVHQEPGSATVTLDDGSRLVASYVVGCDGARSTVRRSSGSGQHDLRFEEPWLVVDLVLHEPVASLPGHALQICDPSRPHTLVPMPGARFRFEFMVLPGEDPDGIQRDEVITELLAPWVPTGAATVERRAVYTFHGLIAERWRSGRVLLAGDAAHQMPPFLGQGMCSGMRDAANLAWKLDAVLAGAPDRLLDTYQAEREPHVRAIVEAAVGFGRVICTVDRDAAATRDAAMLAAHADRGPQPDQDPSVMLPAMTGPLVTVGGGRPARQPTLHGGVRLDDAAGAGWAVITRDPSGLGSGALEAWAAIGATVLAASDDPALAAVLDHAGAGADVAVVRPDRHLYGAARSLADLGEPPALVRTLATGAATV